MDKTRLETVLTVTYLSELAVIRGLLEAEGIASYVPDEFTVTAQPFYADAIGGVKLQVHEDDRERALTIIRDAGFA
ncbi:MAG: DUF2007 domain-containing protein [Bacteroidales bacterium]|jgi:hypothetical protein|nr:DUF2007 domain-containing protein [Bacteroidales bacterium]